MSSIRIDNNYNYPKTSNYRLMVPLTTVSRDPCISQIYLATIISQTPLMRTTIGAHPIIDLAFVTFQSPHPPTATSKADHHTRKRHTTQSDHRSILRGQLAKLAKLDPALKYVETLTSSLASCV